MIDDLDDILKDPLFDLTSEEISLFSFPKTMLVKSERNKAEYVAQRKPCDNFHEYEPLFQQVHRELKSGKRSLIKYNEKSLKEGGFYLVSGVMVYLSKITSFERTTKNKSHIDGRTHVIYENGTESDLKIRSLGKNIHNDGFVITECKDTDEQAINVAFNVNETAPSGWIYVLESLSPLDGIANQKDLYKIGFSTNPVQERIKNCEYEPTYLMDKVKIIATWRTHDMYTQKFEALIHQFFAAVRFHFKIYDLVGQVHEPKEWFVVPLSIINAVVKYIEDKSIVNYTYNHQLQVLQELPEKSNRYKSEKLNTEGWAILSLIIKNVYFKEILSGEKRIEYRDLKESRINTYTWVEQGTGIRYLKQYDALRLYVGYHKDRESALVEVVDITYNAEAKVVEYHLGKVLELDIKTNRIE